ncbi:hypothetical protein GJ744_009935 [Endocarpon pusillum]|uniref:Uncharacterized protein n=1 Tax=Endocarpon pusillum TaxID=364733 RepID=A0A8H7AIU5_9EURO|nr:hypothetical protein GJ744_009935 [Endocarpon pusillum]
MAESNEAINKRVEFAAEEIRQERSAGRAVNVREICLLWDVPRNRVMRRLQGIGSHMQCEDSAEEDVLNLYQQSQASLLSLQHDFLHLHDRALTLSSRYNQGMNNVTLAQSNRAMRQAERVGKLTLVAFFLIPLSSTTSCFGMNFTQFSAGNKLSIWTWFVVSVPVFGLSIAFLNWNYLRLIAWWEEKTPYSKYEDIRAA